MVWFGMVLPAQACMCMPGHKSHNVGHHCPAPQSRTTMSSFLFFTPRTRDCKDTEDYFPIPCRSTKVISVSFIIADNLLKGNAYHKLKISPISPACFFILSSTLCKLLSPSERAVLTPALSHFPFFSYGIVLLSLSAPSHPCKYQAQ